MHDALVGLLDKVDTAVAESAGALRRTEVDSVAALARATRMRLSYPESIVVVALAGGTGSGKSSLVNAIVDEDVALTGGIRPMTSAPLALVPTDGAEALGGYLDELGISDRVEHHGPSWLCVLDLPDNDSVEVEHRHRVDSLLPRVDMIVWVTDPEKYRDAVIHHRYISPMSGYQEQFIFVLNQIDRLDPEDAVVVADDLGRALREDGIREPKVIATAASPVAGPPFGVDLLMDALGAAVGRRLAVNRKALADLANASSQLVRSSSTAHAVDFERQWAEEVASAVDLAIAGRAAGGGHDLAEYVTRLATEMGGETQHRLQDLAIETHGAFLRCVAAEGSTTGTSRSWLRRRRRDAGPAGTANREDLIARVDVEIGGPIRELLVQRGRAHAAITDLALALGDLERTSG
ncbi:MAG TPA: hypothetical protein VFU96_10795 [Acidimicrobiia bacterium]|nr:hypothetical protein [Acidimicrobiia bacterium]